MGAIEIKRGDKCIEITLGKELDISQASHLKEKFDEVFAAHLPMKLTLDAIERIDTAVTQLIVAFYQSARSRDIPLICPLPSSQFAQALRLLGLSQVIELPA